MLAATQLGHSNTAALCVGGGTPPVTNNLNANNESWNGTNWTEVNDVNTARRSATGAGTPSAALFFGGVAANPEATTGRTELWNGTNWTEVNDMNRGPAQGNGLGGAGQGTSTATLGFGGNSPTKKETESWNGTNWSNENDMVIARPGTTGTGTQASALNFGGEPFLTSAQEWNGTGLVTTTVTTTSD